MPYKKKAPAKRTKKAVGGALSAAQKRMLGQVQKEMVNRGAGAITKEVVGMTRKYGDHRKSATVAAPKRKAPAKRKAPTSSAGRVLKQLTPAQMRALRARGQTAKPKKGGIAMSKAARAQLMQQQKLAAARKRRGRPTTRRPAVGSTPRTLSRMTPAQRRAAARRRAMMLARKRKAPSSRGRLTAAQKRARMAAARRRAMAAARKRRAPSRRIKRPTRRPSGLSRAGLALRARRASAARRARSAGRPTSRRAPTRRAPTRSRGRRGLGRMLRRVSRMR